MAFAPECFFGLPSAGFSPGRNFAEFKKMRAEGVLAKFAIAPLYEHFGSRGLLQNVVLCLHFKCILIRRQWHLRQDVFSGLLSAGFSTSRKFAEFQKMRAEGVLAKFAIARFYGHLGSRSLLQKLCYVGTLKHSYQEIMTFARGCFSWPSFCRFFPWSQLCRISENGR